MNTCVVAFFGVLFVALVFLEIIRRKLNRERRELELLLTRWKQGNHLEAEAAYRARPSDGKPLPHLGLSDAP